MYGSTVPDKLLNLRMENTQNKFTPKTLLRNDHMTIIFIAQQKQIAGLMLKFVEPENSETTLEIDLFSNTLPQFLPK